ncbi:hypothetical protein KVR01_013413 [Diaporthe batatas]|uniref:uncharacterized protein n=1 Tax=Diaporthe batatas TaxID=748121 RepID=UPI001D048C7D|nr:uncharacterized protein KVR01_013413 [Diaporthe batatas]KAG8156808.1 hypothetical protein KVR01_013413 [Diaporthe batatas]
MCALQAYNFSSSLDDLSDTEFFLDDSAASVFTGDSSAFNFNIPPMMPPTSDGGGVGDNNNITTTPILNETGFSLWGFDPHSSDSASFITGGTVGPEPTTRPTPQIRECDTIPRDQTSDVASVNLDSDVAAAPARSGLARVPHERPRMNWRIDRDDEQATDPGTTYDPLLEDLAGAMSHGKKDRHLQDQAAGIMKKLMARSQACCHVTACSYGSHGELERQEVDISELPVHEIIDGNSDL